MEINRENLGSVAKSLNRSLLFEDVPDSDSLVPTATDQESSVRAEAKGGNRTSVAIKDINELTCPQTPDKNVERVDRARNYDISTVGVNGNAIELSGLVCLKNSEVPILYKIVSSNCPVH